MHYKPQLPDESVNVTSNNFFVEAFKLLVGLVVVLILSYALLMFVIGVGIDHLSIDHEKKIHKMLAQKIDRNQSKEEHYLQSIVDDLNRCAKLPYNLEVSISSSSQVNAMALIGGRIIVTQGMLDAIQNENELSFVLGHEMAHFKHRDHLKGMSSGIVLTLFSIFLGNNSSTILNQLLEMEQMHYSKKQESHADRFGVDMLMCRYNTTVGSSDLFARMTQEDQWSDFMLTHPNFSKRVKKIENYIVQKGLNQKGESVPLQF